MMIPGASPGQIPPFHQIGEYRFQDMCRDIFEQESRIATCNVFGVRGQSQYGVDLLAYRKNRDGIEVAQCKCYESINPAQIAQVSDEFLTHWEYWQTKEVKKFLLLVPCDLSRTDQQNEFLKQKGRFSALGLDYEVWSGSTITNKLRPHPGIVSHYMTPPQLWVQIICGQAQPAFLAQTSGEDRTSVLVDTLIMDQLSQIGESISMEIQSQIESMLRAWREGRQEEVGRWIRTIRNDTPRWNILSPEIQSRIICIEGRVVLSQNGDIESAKQLAEEAEQLHRSPELFILRAMIAYSESGPEAGLILLEGRTDIDSLNLTAAFLIELGRGDEALRILPPNGSGDI